MYSINEYTNKIIHADCKTGLSNMPDESVDCIITSPPYFGKRDYGTAQWIGGSPDCDHAHKWNGGGRGVLSEKQIRSQGTQNYQYKDNCEKCGAKRIDQQIGLEETPKQYIENLAGVFAECYRVLKDTGTLWVNLGDTFASARGIYHAHAQTISGKKSRGEPGEGRLPDLRKHGYKHTELLGLPWMLAFALRDLGYMLRNEIIWHKPNPMPESVSSRLTVSHETIFLFVKSDNPTFFVHAEKEYADCFYSQKTRPAPDYIWKDKETGQTFRTAPENWQDEKLDNGERRYSRVNLWRGCNYYFDADSIKEPLSPNSDVKYRQNLRRGKQYNAKEPYKKNMPKSFDLEGRNRRSVWTIPTKSYTGAHFATFPLELIMPMVIGGCPPGGLVLDPFMGAGTTALVAQQYGRYYLGFELNPDYIKLAEDRLNFDTHILKVKAPKKPKEDKGGGAYNLTLF